MSYRELADRLRAMQPHQEIFCSGRVVKVEGLICVVQVGSAQLEANLRPTALEQEGELLVIPKVGSAVVLGCMSGDFSRLLVLSADVVERVLISGQIVINGGGLGGLVNIGALTEKLNSLVDAINSHSHTDSLGGATTPPLTPADSFVRDDYEDNTVKH